MIEVERRCRIEIDTVIIYVDVVFKNTKIIHVTAFTFKPQEAIEVLSYDEASKKWMDAWATWPGPVGGDLKTPGLIRIKLIDSQGFKWDSPLKEFLNPKLFTTKEYL